MKQSLTFVAYALFPLAWMWFALLITAVLYEHIEDEFIKVVVILLTAFIAFTLFLVILNSV